MPRGEWASYAKCQFWLSIREMTVISNALEFMLEHSGAKNELEIDYHQKVYKRFFDEVQKRDPHSGKVIK